MINVWLPRKWTSDGVRQIEAVRTQITEVPGVAQASVNHTFPGWNPLDFPSLYRQGQSDDKTTGTFAIATDDKYAETFKMPLLGGKFFSGANVANDSSSIVINETLLKDLGWHSPNEAIGKMVINDNDSKQYKLSGVVKDFHVRSKQWAIEPLAFFSIYQSNTYRFLSIRLKPGNTQQTIEALQKNGLH